MSKRECRHNAEPTFSETQHVNCEITTDKYNEQDSRLCRATSEPAHCLCWVRRPWLKLPQSRHLCSLCATIAGDKIERTAFLKCQPVGVLQKYLPSPSLSILIDKATFDNAACCHHDIWSPFFFPLTWLAAE